MLAEELSLEVRGTHCQYEFVPEDALVLNDEDYVSQFFGIHELAELLLRLNASRRAVVIDFDTTVWLIPMIMMVLGVRKHVSRPLACQAEIKCARANVSRSCAALSIRSTFVRQRSDHRATTFVRFVTVFVTIVSAVFVSEVHGALPVHDRRQSALISRFCFSNFLHYFLPVWAHSITQLLTHERTIIVTDREVNQERSCVVKVV